METYSYKAFISYRHTSPDQEIASKLHTLIETYSVPRDIRASLGIQKMGRVFRDQEELPLSKDLGADIRKALDNSEWLIVVCSPRYLESKWCNAELDYFIELGRRDHILPILVEGEPDQSFPPQVRFEEVDGRIVEIEPLAADVRGADLSESLKKLQNEKLRILAPMLGVNYDQLRQRARRRRNRMLAGSAAAVFALLSGILIYTIIKNRQVTAQRNIALDNQMQLLVEQANIASSGGNKLAAVQQLLEAEEVRGSVGTKNDSQFQAALEYALYNSEFESILTIDNQNRHFSSLRFSHNDKYILGITNINSAALIDATTGKLLYTVSRSDVGQLDSVGFTKDDKYFYMVDSWFGFVTMYKTETGEFFRQFDGSGQYTWNISNKAYALEGRLLIPKEKALVLWDYENDKYEEVLVPEDMVEYNRSFDILDVSPDEKYVAIGTQYANAGMRICSLDEKTVIPLEHDENRGYQCIRYSGDGRFIAGHSGSQYCVWNAADGRMILKGDMNEKTGTSPEVVINYDGSILLVMSSDFLGAVDVASGKLLWEKTDDSIYVTEAYISGNGKYVAASGGISGIFDILTGDMLSDQPGTLFSNDSKKIMVNAYDEDPRLLATPELATVSRVSSFSESLYEVPRYTEPGRMIYIPIEHNVGEFYKSFPNNVNRRAQMFTSPDLKYAVQTHEDGYMEVFDIENKDQGVKLYTLAEHCWESVTDVIFSGDIMASTGGYDPRCVLFDLKTGQILRVLPGKEYCFGCEFSKDGSKIIIFCGFARNYAYVYSTENGNLLYTFELEEGKEHFSHLGFTEDGSKVVAEMEEGGAIVGTIYPTLEQLVDEARER